MSKLSSVQGKGYEFACINALKKVISAHREVRVLKNSSYEVCQSSWLHLNKEDQETFDKSALAGAVAIIDLEPLILDDGEDMLELELQADNAGQLGDVRDILIIRRNIEWEIGLSIKHNHFAVKHSRLAKNLDFGERWFDIKCSSEYWEEIDPIFSLLEKKKELDMKWRDMTNKVDDVYVPMLNAFMNEIRRSYKTYGKEITTKMVEYLLGKYDFYKVVGVDRKKATQLFAFNMRGALGKSSKLRNSNPKLTKVSLPTRIIQMGFKPKSKTTVEMFLDNGWQLSFRIHNASTKVETSLKLDIQLMGMPASLIVIEQSW